MQIKDIKIIFVDIDWTILNHKDGHNFDTYSLNTLIEAQKKGIKVFYCTARPYYSVSQIGGFDLLKPDGVISANGGVVQIGDKTIYKQGFPSEILKQCCETALKHSYNMLCSTVDNCFMLLEKDEHFDNYLKVYYEPIPCVDTYKDKDVISLILFAPERMDEIFKKELPSGISYFRYHESAVEILYQPHEKSEGVIETLKYYGFKKEQSISFGDDYGDIAMFEASGIGIAVGNARDEVKKHADYITLPVSEGGVGHALKKLGIV